jgi:hypothetical protein
MMMLAAISKMAPYKLHLLPTHWCLTFGRSHTLATHLSPAPPRRFRGLCLLAASRNNEVALGRPLLITHHPRHGNYATHNTIFNTGAA